MALRFNRLIRPNLSYTTSSYRAERIVTAKSVGDTMVFMSHKTGDIQAENIAKDIAARHQIEVYMAEWDDTVRFESDDLPEHIMLAIRESDGFLVNVIAEIAVSMWIGYEIGGAHAMQKPRAKIVFDTVPRLPSVVEALESLHSQYQVDQWIVGIKGMLRVS